MLRSRVESDQRVGRHPGLAVPDASIRNDGDAVRARGRPARRSPFLDLARRQIQPAQKTSRVIAVIDAAVGRERQPAWAGAVRQRVLADGHRLGVDRRELVRAELAEDRRPLRGDDHAVRLRVARRDLAQLHLAAPWVEPSDGVCLLHREPDPAA